MRNSAGVLRLVVILALRLVRREELTEELELLRVAWLQEESNMVPPRFQADGLFQKLMRGERCRRVAHMYMCNIRTVGMRADGAG